MKLADVIRGRDNNFNLIRVVAAFAVLIGHSFALALGTRDEPVRNILGMSLGYIAVDVFFITSGFLVTASLLTRQSVVKFAWARILRIFPALFAMLLLTVLGVGVFFTTFPLHAYLSNSAVYIYLLRGFTLIFGVSFYLPGVFESNPFRGMVNASLWTMPYEIAMYIILGLVWGALRISKENRLKLFHLVIIIGAVASGIFVITRHFLHPFDDLFARFFYLFFSGAAFYILRERITLSRPVFWLLTCALVASAMVNKDVFFVVYELTIVYILFYIAYIPSGFVRNYNRVGDYSYGVYIYASVVQQSVAALIPGVSVLNMVLLSAPVTLLLAMLSWHFLERHALALKRM